MKDIDTGYRRLILVCINERQEGEAACAQRGSSEIHRRIKEAVKARGLSRVIRVTRSRCLGQCQKGPTVAIYPENRWYGSVSLKDVETILRNHVDDLGSE